jgi:hypothetical protein
VTGRTTRGSQLLRRGDFLSSSGQKSVFYKGISLYNGIPEDIRSSGYGDFKRRLHNYFRTQLE